MEERTTLEECITIAEDEAAITAHEAKALRAELRTLRAGIAAYSDETSGPMATWYDVYRLMDDNIIVRKGGDFDAMTDHHAIGWLLSALLSRDLTSAREAIKTYEQQVPGFAYDRGARWDWIDQEQQQ